jgi:hypothetical protein
MALDKRYEIATSLNMVSVSWSRSGKMQWTQKRSKELEFFSRLQQYTPHYQIS